MARVLYVDDEDLLCRAIQRMMKGSRHEVVTAVGLDGGRKAYAEQGPFDVLVTDYYLGAGTRGTDLIDEVQKDQPSLKVILVSGGLVALPRDDIYELAKPFTREDLEGLIDRVSSSEEEPTPQR